MGAFLSQCRKTTIDIIPDREIMIDVVDRIVMFESILKGGGRLTAEQEKERRALEPAIREIRKQTKSKDEAV